MGEEDAIYAVMSALSDYVKSPSLRHIRDQYMLRKLAYGIVRGLLQRSRVWKKWEGEREPFLRAAANCWIPVEDMRTFLNGLPGPSLTQTDVTERLRAFHEEPYEKYPNPDLQAGCLAFYAVEKAEGTEMAAIAGALRDYIEREEERLNREKQAAWKASIQADKAALEQRYISGADCKWTPVQGSTNLYCRINGRSYRLSPTSDKRWDLHRIDTIDDKGVLVGRYAQRRDVTKVLAQVAYQPEFGR
jgi:hypothetical protein